MGIFNHFLKIYVFIKVGHIFDGGGEGEDGLKMFTKYVLTNSVYTIYTRVWWCKLGIYQMAGGGWAGMSQPGNGGSYEAKSGEGGNMGVRFKKVTRVPKSTKKVPKKYQQGSEMRGGGNTRKWVSCKWGCHKWGGFSTQNNNMDYGCAFCKWGSHHSTKHPIPLNFGLIHLISLREYLKWRSLLT